MTEKTLSAEKAALVDGVREELTPTKDATVVVEKRQSKTEVSVGGKVVNKPKTSPPVDVSPKSGKLTFDMYAQLRNVPELRKAGMRAFTQTKSATPQEWDRIFLNY